MSLVCNSAKSIKCHNLVSRWSQAPLSRNDIHGQHHMYKEFLQGLTKKYQPNSNRGIAQVKTCDLGYSLHLYPIEFKSK